MLHFYIYRLQTRPLVREGAIKIRNPQLSERNFMEKEKLVAGPRWAPDCRKLTSLHFLNLISVFHKKKDSSTKKQVMLLQTARLVRIVQSV
jgi:tRNA nucleotidyltransferase/poly(A) polymerase